jgi:hypothetical protein
MSVITFVLGAGIRPPWKHLRILARQAENSLKMGLDLTGTMSATRRARKRLGRVHGGRLFRRPRGRHLRSDDCGAVLDRPSRSIAPGPRRSLPVSLGNTPLPCLSTMTRNLRFQDSCEPLIHPTPRADKGFWLSKAFYTCPWYLIAAIQGRGCCSSPPRFTGQRENLRVCRVTRGC